MAQAELPAALSSLVAGKAVKSCERIREEWLSRRGGSAELQAWGASCPVETAGDGGVGVLQGEEENVVHLKPRPYCQVSLPAKVHAMPARLALWL